MKIHLEISCPKTIHKCAYAAIIECKEKVNTVVLALPETLAKTRIEIFVKNESFKLLFGRMLSKKCSKKNYVIDFLCLSK